MCPGRFLDLIGGDPSVSKSIQLHVDMFRFVLIKPPGGGVSVLKS